MKKITSSRPKGGIFYTFNMKPEFSLFYKQLGLPIAVISAIKLFYPNELEGNLFISRLPFIKNRLIRHYIPESPEKSDILSIEEYSNVKSGKKYSRIYFHPNLTDGKFVPTLVVGDNEIVAKMAKRDRISNYYVGSFSSYWRPSSFILTRQVNHGGVLVRLFEKIIENSGSESFIHVLNSKQDDLLIEGVYGLCVTNSESYIKQ